MRIQIHITKISNYRKKIHNSYYKFTVVISRREVAVLWGEGGPPFRMLHVVTFAVWGAVTFPLVTLWLGTITVRRYHISPYFQKTAVLLQGIQGNT